MGGVGMEYSATDTSITEYICYVDGGCYRNGAVDAAAYGSFKVFKNDKELVKEDTRFPLVAKFRQTCNTAESMSVNKLLGWILGSGILKNPKNVAIIRSDSELTIRQIKGVYTIKEKRLLHIHKKRLHILNKIKEDTGRNPWKCIRYSKIARQRIVDVLGH
jgi:ribonuclease HI